MGRVSSYVCESSWPNPLLQQALILWLNNESPESVHTLSLLGPQSLPSYNGKSHLNAAALLSPHRVDSFLAPVRVLRLQSVSFEWASSVYRGLVQLELSYVPEKLSPTLKHMVNILSACPMLRILKLAALSVLHRQGEPTRFPPVTLDKLESLDVLGMSAVNCSRVLAILAPGPHELDVRISLYDDPQSAEAVSSFFDRSNITKLFVKTYGHLVAKYITRTKRLRVLVLDFGVPQIRRRNSILDTLTPSLHSGFTRHTQISPELHTLWLINGAFDVGNIKGIAEAYSVQKLGLTEVTTPSREQLELSVKPVVKSLLYGPFLGE